MFPTPILGKISVGFLVQYWEKVLGTPNRYWDRFYRFPKPVLEKGSIGSLSNTGKNVLYVPHSILGKVL